MILVLYSSVSHKTVWLRILILGSDCSTEATAAEMSKKNEEKKVYLKWLLKDVACTKEEPFGKKRSLTVLGLIYKCCQDDDSRDEVIKDERIELINFWQGWLCLQDEIRKNLLIEMTIEGWYHLRKVSNLERPENIQKTYSYWIFLSLLTILLPIISSLVYIFVLIIHPCLKTGKRKKERKTQLSGSRLLISFSDIYSNHKNKMIEKWKTSCFSFFFSFQFCSCLSVIDFWSALRLREVCVGEVT